MSPEFLLHKFGYLAVFVGTFLEGETILVMAGFFAERGHLRILLVIVTAFGGAFVGHIFWFWLGRRRGMAVLSRFPRLMKHFSKGIRIFERYGAPAIFVTQWLYGLRITCAVIVGISRIPAAKFILYEAISCIVWAIVIGGAGFVFGRAVERILGRAASIEKWGLIVLLAIGLGTWAYHQWKDRKDEC